MIDGVKVQIVNTVVFLAVQIALVQAYYKNVNGIKNLINFILIQFKKFFSHFFFQGECNDNR